MYSNIHETEDHEEWNGSLDSVLAASRPATEEEWRVFLHEDHLRHFHGPSERVRILIQDVDMPPLEEGLTIFHPEEITVRVAPTRVNPIPYNQIFIWMEHTFGDTDLRKPWDYWTSGWCEEGDIFWCLGYGAPHIQEQ